MEKVKFKNNNGITLIGLILLILFTILVVFLAYEIFYVDVFEIMNSEEKNPISVFANLTDGSIASANEEFVNKNEEVIAPITENNQYQSSETVNSVNHYYYNQLDDAGRIIYKGLEDNIENMKSGNYNIEFKSQFNDLLNTANGDKKLNIAFQSGWNAFTYDYVGIFYIDVTKLILTTQTTSIGSFATHKVSLSSGDNENYFNEGVTSYADLKQKEEYIVNIRKKIVSQLQGYSEYDQVKYVHDWMIDNFKYDVDNKNSNSHSVYGAFASREVVCEGYARAFKYILDGLGIENVLASGTATNSNGVTELHAWNYVKLDGKWYAVDVTWDDPVIINGVTLTKELKYKYFLKGSNTFFKNHSEDGYLSQNSIEFSFPTIEKEDCNLE